MRYSSDFRIKVLSVKQAEGLSIRAAAKRFAISPTTLSSWIHRPKAKKPGPKGSTRKVNLCELEADVNARRDDFIFERAKRFGVSNSTICRNLKKLSFSHKKNMGTSQS